MMMTRLAVNNFELLPDSVLRDPVAARAGTHSHAHFVLIIKCLFLSSVFIPVSATYLEEKRKFISH